MDHADAREFARVSAELLNEPQEPATLRGIVEGVVDVVPACDFASISLRMKNGSIETPVSTSPIVDACDDLQYSLHEGPCLSAIWSGESFIVKDVAHDPRFPNWGPAAAAEGAGSIVSLRLFTSSKVLGALNIYSARPFAFTQDDVDVAVIFARHAATALSAAKLISGLETAVLTRHTIGMAQGILMSRYGITADRAFDVLRRYSSSTNTKLRDVAVSVVESGHLPQVTDDRPTTGQQSPAPPS